MINDKMIARINELSRKKKESGLTAEEALEQADLRRQYIDAFKSSLRHQLDQIEFVDEPGHKPH